MTHPLTPREQYEQAKRDFNNMRDDGTITPREKVAFKQPCEHCHRMTTVDLTALASGSGDHAELIEDAMDALQIIDAFPSNQGEVEGRITEKGDRMLSSCTKDVRRALETLLAENAALRERGDRLNERCRRFHDQVASQSTRATEAECKLAEAVGLLLKFHEAWRSGCGWLPSLNVLDDEITAFLSREAERG